MYRIHTDDAISGVAEIAVPIEEAVTCESAEVYYEEDYYEDDYYGDEVVECATASVYDEDDYWY
jgi:hypothetical protein